MLLAAPLIAAVVGATPQPAEEATTQERSARLFGRRPPGRNAVMLRGTFPIPDFGLAAAYDRALGRRFSVGAQFEYVLPRVGYAHLVGFSETLDGRVWIGRALHGVFFAASMTVAHHVLAGAPQLRRTAVAPGASLGFRYTLPAGLSLGASGGLRWSAVVDPQPIICTRELYCAATAQGVGARLTVDVGWVF